ncbi:MAG: DUF2089 family protein, partial [Oscillospiraceae bacterium]|nr:DUF2089 family protein [Oscillospiraceae bacterium]
MNMNRPFLKCPACQGALHISALRCPDCDLELKNAFRFSEFDCLGEEQLQ